jgi:hypothetical protein
MVLQGVFHKKTPSAGGIKSVGWILQAKALRINAVTKEKGPK